MGGPDSKKTRTTVARMGVSISRLGPTGQGAPAREERRLEESPGGPKSATPASQARSGPDPARLHRKPGTWNGGAGVGRAVVTTRPTAGTQHGIVANRAEPVDLQCANATMSVSAARSRAGSVSVSKTPAARPAGKRGQSPHLQHEGTGAGRISLLRQKKKPTEVGATESARAERVLDSGRSDRPRHNRS